jgi:hypothetical protein
MDAEAPSFARCLDLVAIGGVSSVTDTLHSISAAGPVKRCCVALARHNQPPYPVNGS